MKTKALVLAVAFFAAGCLQTEPMTEAEMREKAAEQYTSLGYGPIVAITKEEEVFREFLANSTLKSYSGHGTQIEYLGADGTAQLWYPGNQSTVPSQWTVTTRLYETNLCFKYPSSSFNPLTQKFGGKWECYGAVFYLDSLDELVPGDPLGLRKGNIPYVLPKRKDVSIADAATSAGKNVRIGANKLSWKKGF